VLEKLILGMRVILSCDKIDTIVTEQPTVKTRVLETNLHEHVDHEQLYKLIHRHDSCVVPRNFYKYLILGLVLSDETHIGLVSKSFYKEPRSDVLMALTKCHRRQLETIKRVHVWDRHVDTWLLPFQVSLETRGPERVLGVVSTTLWTAPHL